MIFTIVLLVLVIPLMYVVVTYVDCLLKLRKYPRGPFPLPVIGNLHMMGPNPHETFRGLAKMYGNVFSISLGMERVVVINTFEAAREALISKGNNFAGRPTNHYTSKFITKGFKDIVFADYGRFWKFVRKLGHSSLKMFGDGIGNLETKVIEESEELHLRLKKKIGEPVDMQQELGLTMLNIICSIAFGHRYKIDDSEFQQMIIMQNLFTDGFASGDPVTFLPWLRFFPLKNMNKLRKAVDIRDRIMYKHLLEHKNSFDPENIRDFMDSLIQTSKEAELWEELDVQEVTDDHLVLIVSDIFFAGSETTVTTLRWCIIYLLHWPKYQDLIYREIIRVIGTERYPELNDRKSLPLVQATIQETLRLSSITPLGIPHKAMEDEIIAGESIPKNTQILFNFWNIHHDEREWKDPEEFDPYRWLDEENKYIPGKHKSFMPFSAGRRACLGESMAKTELFLILSRMMRDFKFEPHTETSLPSKEGRGGIIRTPNPYTVKIKLRAIEI